MTAEQLALIKESWSALLADVKAHYDNVLSTEDLKNLTVNQLLELIEFSKNLIGKMEALFCDYRHIIGMATIKITDRNFLTSILRDIELYRTDAKRIAGITDLNLVNLIPASSAYELKLTPGIELKSKVRPGQEGPETSSEVEIPLAPESDPESFMRLAGDNIIKFTLDKLEEAQIMFEQIGAPITEAAKKIKSSGQLTDQVSSNGIRVSFDPKNKTFQACAKTDRSKKLLKRYISNHRELVVK